MSSGQNLYVSHFTKWTCKANVHAQSLETADLPRTQRIADESRMVKRFQRSAAGIDEQLPSDLRPPEVLKVRPENLQLDVVGTHIKTANLRLSIRRTDSGG